MSATAVAIHAGAKEGDHWEVRVRLPGREPGGAWWPDEENARADFLQRRQRYSADISGDEQILRLELVDSAGTVVSDDVVLSGELTALRTPFDATPVSSRGAAAPTAFVSWAHRGSDWSTTRAADWERTIAEFTGLLRTSGVDTDVDLFHLNDPGVNWQTFGTDRIQRCDFILIAVSAPYRERWDGTNAPTEGAGAAREARALRGMFDENQADFQRRVKVVILPGAGIADIPLELRALQHFAISSLANAESLEDLLRTLTDQPAYPMPALGRIPVFPPRALKEPSNAPTEVPVRTVREQRLHEAEELDRQLVDLNMAETAETEMSDPAASHAVQPARQRALLEGLLRATRSLEGEADDKWAIVDGPNELQPLADHRRFRWDLRRGEAKRTIVVELSGSVLASEPAFLPSMIADAVESYGRSAIEQKCLDARDATSILKVTTTGLQLL
ncbi:hypothetical protein C8N24_4075 [Solirubrobacter pauli]|uniref:SEFIR domain-containing protein n=2 Tax=Solirubrobacter pauli TaxID=166793 RepID=A0A660KWM1_9ACTN|nr:hypothetical protein C8N24_4075 [Solirubrobacter pauli]